jgi:hypothetical protein
MVIELRHGESMTKSRFTATQNMSTDSSPHYLCQRCGNCCRWPGDVRVTDAEVERIADYIGLSVDRFVQTHTRVNANRTGLSLIDKPNGECIFLEGKNVCQIQAVKPVQCEGFPNVWNFPGWRDVCEAIEVT